MFLFFVPTGEAHGSSRRHSSRRHSSRRHSSRRHSSHRHSSRRHSIKRPRRLPDGAGDLLPGSPPCDASPAGDGTATCSFVRLKRRRRRFTSPVPPPPPPLLSSPTGFVSTICSSVAGTTRERPGMAPNPCGQASIGAAVPSRYERFTVLCGYCSVLSTCTVPLRKVVPEFAPGRAAEHDG